MNKTLTKLIMAALALVLAVSVAVMSTYAWMILSKSPEVGGIQINIGSNTILIAPDVARTVNGQEYHYPGQFSEKLNFSQVDNYDYLQSLNGLSPVSTANGLDWFLSDADGYTLDYNLAHANLLSNDAELSQGHYIYLDFWVVSPSEEYTLRVSSDGNAGSFVIDLMDAYQTGDKKYEIGINAEGSAAASVRVGFLVDETYMTAEALEHYPRNQGGLNSYNSLKGVFSSDRENYSFYIYEPNGDFHPDENLARPGSYVVTSPVGFENGEITQVDIRDRLSVQLTNRWRQTPKGSYELAERFQTAIAGKNLSGKTIEEIEGFFYRDYLQYQVSSYVAAARFIKNTRLLYAAASADTVSASTMSALSTDGATEDAYIVKLEKNVPQRIRMFIWLEGQDVDCASSAFADSFALSLELAGGSE